MPRLYVSPEKLQGERATLDESAHRHLVKVLRLAPGAAVRLFDGNGAEIDARIEAVGKHTVDVSLGDRRQVAVPTCSITLVQSLPKGERMDWVVQKTTELGVARILPVLTLRGMAKPPEHRRTRWRTIAEEAARQCGRADVPEIAACQPLCDVLPSFAGSPARRLVLWEAERGQSLRQGLSDGPKHVVLLVGPEGGFSVDEIEHCTEAGFLPVGLGPRILRTETAAVVAVALAQAAAGGLDGA